jgi:hypothetical protein
VIKQAAGVVALSVPVAQGFVAWAVTATLDGICGLGLGLMLIPLTTRVIGPLLAAVTGKKATGH